MTHSYKPTWSDFYASGLGPSLPLSSQQQAQLISGVLPSGESNGFDNAQLHILRSEAPAFKGSGINAPYPYPNTGTLPQYAYLSGESPTGKFSTTWWETSGILRTYPATDGSGLLVDKTRNSGVFHYNGPSGRFSNGEKVKSSQITDFTLFNGYIHHELMPTTKTSGSGIKIPYISTFKTSINWNQYPSG